MYIYKNVVRITNTKHLSAGPPWLVSSVAPCHVAARLATPGAPGSLGLAAGSPRKPESLGLAASSPTKPEGRLSKLPPSQAEKRKIQTSASRQSKNTIAWHA